MGMTPDEHYREAERILAIGAEAEAMILALLQEHESADVTEPERTLRRIIAKAQVHATLATLGKRAES